MKGLAFLFHFPSISAFISIRGFFVTFFLGSLLAGMGHLTARLVRLIKRWIRGPEPNSMSLSAGILFYRRMAQLLARHELVRNPAETQSEFAGRARTFLASHGNAAQTVSGVPQQVVDAFYRVRFGDLELEPASLAELDARLDALESSLNDS
jgi:hypothetical protein